MYNENKNRFLLPAMIIRRGTSKDVYLPERDLPEGKSQRGSLLLSMMGSPDKKQIDGPNSTQLATNRVVIVKKSSREDADVNYTFVQVLVDKDLVNYKGNYGNISSGVEPSAIEEGLIETKEGATLIRILNTNTNRVIITDVQTEKDSVVYDDDLAIAGVPGTATPIKLKFVESAETPGNGFLSTGNVVDILEVPSSGKIGVSIADAANLFVFIKAKGMGMTSLKLPEEANADADKFALLETVRGPVAVMIGLIEDHICLVQETPGIPKITFVTEATDYVIAESVSTSKGNVDLPL